MGGDYKIVTSSRFLSSAEECGKSPLVHGCEKVHKQAYSENIIRFNAVNLAQRNIKGAAHLSKSPRCGNVNSPPSVSLSSRAIIGLTFITYQASMKGAEEISRHTV